MTLMGDHVTGARQHHCKLVNTPERDLKTTIIDSRLQITYNGDILPNPVTHHTITGTYRGTSTSSTHRTPLHRWELFGVEGERLRRG
ncbi:hypothetical protein E2C01_027743 [Portunus trituberculatus]|uniref:Uncharacterized protein n=1 Tax=Portunus trituberculatus TaxID=210409 RepID=A0A5B7EM02_PORTR|nr:hypothetical protein [Portunus trituberculatus]